ncbi:MAG: MFS transporter [Chloroflexota bacterium]
MSSNPLQVFYVLRQRHIRLLWLGQLLSAFGDRFFEIAVVWLSVQIIGSEAGFVLAAGSIARLICGLLGGVYADRWDRQKVMIAVDILRTLTILSLPLAALIGEITLVQLAIVAAIEAGLSGFFDPALQASLPTLADNTQTLQASNALLDVTSRMARIFAPGLAGLLTTFVPLEHFFSIDAVTFAVSAVALFAIGRDFAWRPEQDVAAKRGLRAIFDDVWSAMQLVRQNRAVFWSLLSYVPANVAWSAIFMVGLALLADEVLNEGVQGFSFLITGYGIGSVLSNIVVGGMQVKNRPRFLFAGVVIFGLGLLLLGLTSSFTLALGCMFIASLGTPMSDLLIVLMIQEEFPANQVGKVYSLRLTISSLGFSAGLLLAAPLFQWVSISLGILLLGLLVVVVGVAGVVRFYGTAV